MDSIGEIEVLTGVGFSVADIEYIREASESYRRRFSGEA
jgi:hypothetical protein